VLTGGIGVGAGFDHRAGGEQVQVRRVRIAIDVLRIDGDVAVDADVARVSLGAGDVRGCITEEIVIPDDGIVGVST
jgi:hypothetical protein